MVKLTRLKEFLSLNGFEMEKISRDVIGNRRLSAENTCPRNCEHIGFIHTAAGNESRWQGRGYDAAFPLLLGVFCVLHYFTPFSLLSPKLCTRLYILS